MSEGPLCRLALRVDGEADGPELHLRDGMVPITPMRSRRQADDVAGLRLREHALERDGWEVVALVDDYLAVVRDDILNLLLADEALYHRDVELAIPGFLARSDLPDLLRLDAQEERQLRQPLVEKRPSVDQD